MSNQNNRSEEEITMEQFNERLELASSWRIILERVEELGTQQAMLNEAIERLEQILGFQKIEIEASPEQKEKYDEAVILINQYFLLQNTEFLSQANSILEELLSEVSSDSLFAMVIEHILSPICFNLGDPDEAIRYAQKVKEALFPNEQSSVNRDNLAKVIRENQQELLRRFSS
jgi:tetratricopeptide (TPR) repeat protein